MNLFARIVGMVLSLMLIADSPAAIWYVVPNGAGFETGTSWGNAFENPQQAIAASSSGDEIWVKAGTYRPTQQFDGGGDQDKTFALPHHRRMYGGFEGDEAANERHLRNPFVHQTILSGDIGDEDGLLESDNVWHVVRIQSTVTQIDDETQLDGFIITLGYADGGGDYNGLGGGVLVVNGQPIIQNCVMINNHAAIGGGAASDGRDDNSIDPETGNYIHPLADPEFRACRFLNNDSDGSGGGASVGDGYVVYLNCEFSGNLADTDGGGLALKADAGQVGMPTSASVINCTFANNTGNGRSVYNGHDIVIQNTVMWDAGTTTGHLVENSAPSADTTVSNSNIEGDGNTTNADPLYVSETGSDTTAGTLDDNLRLGCGSPSIDAGEQNDVPLDEFDIDDDTTLTEFAPTLARRTRVLQSEVDQGAYETPDSDCPADIDGDHVVEIDDLQAVIDGWGPCPPPSAACTADVDDCGGSGAVDVNDLLAVINAWGPCPGYSGDAGPRPDFEACQEECEGLTGQAWLECMEQCLTGG